MERLPDSDQRKSRWGPPPDSDLIGIPLILGIVVAVLAIVAVSVFIGVWAGMCVLVVVLIAALAISYRVVTGSESAD